MQGMISEFLGRKVDYWQEIESRLLSYTMKDDPMDGIRYLEERIGLLELELKAAKKGT